MADASDNGPSFGPHPDAGRTEDERRRNNYIRGQHLGFGSSVCDMADTSSQPGQQDTRSAFGHEASNGRTGRHTQQPDGHHRPSSYGEGFWDDHIWLTGSDGKSRRSKPGLPLLAYGVSNRVGRLRAYGNAIVPPLAAEVIKAFMECEP